MIRIIVVLFIFFSFSDAKMFQSVKKESGEFIQVGESRFYCPNCGMNLPKFYKTNHIHSNKQYCSLHCLVDATKKEVPADDVKVIDTKTLKFIEAKHAFYVVGSKKRGTMSIKSKYAFAAKKDAEIFQKKFDGKIVDFQTAYAIAKDDFENDMKMISTKKEKKVYKIGKTLYEKKCNQIEDVNYDTIALLKADLKKKCKIKKDKKLQAIAIYLWDIKKLKKHMEKITKMVVPEDAKCPVCGMFVYKYPKWAAMIDMDGKKLYFDGVKDMMKYYLPLFNKIKIENIYVTDYFTTKKIKASDAYYVFASNVYGPMGHELIPFEKAIRANAFKRDHFGKKVITFYDIDDELMQELEEL